MASSKEYLDYVMERLSDLDGVTYRTIIGEYILYSQRRIVGGIYDDRLLIKAVPSAIAYMGNAEYMQPYDGGKKMLLVDDVDDKGHLAGLFEAIINDLPAAKPKPGKIK